MLAVHAGQPVKTRPMNAPGVVDNPSKAKLSFIIKKFKPNRKDVAKVIETRCQWWFKPYRYNELTNEIGK